MEQKSNNTIKIAGAIVILIAAFLIFTYFIKSDPEADLSVDSSQEIIGRRLVDTLQKIRTLELDKSFLSDPAFLSLVDFTVEVVSEPTGRDNPFASIGQ